MADGDDFCSSDIVVEDEASGELYPINSDISELKHLLLRKSQFN